MKTIAELAQIMQALLTTTANAVAKKRDSSNGHHAEQVRPFVGADGHKIRTGLRIIVSLQTGRTPLPQFMPSSWLRRYPL
jgi:hypothetical protein